MTTARDISLKGVGVVTAQVALNAATPTLVLDAKTRVFGEVKNTDAAIIMYLGGADVDAATGYPLAATAAFGLENFVGKLYAIAASGTPTIARIEW